MHSRRVLGVVALGAIVVAAISFAIVDVTLAGVSCPREATCVAGATPPVSITFAALGALALLVSVLPAVSWIVESAQQHRHATHEDDAAAARTVMARPVPAYDDED